MNLRNIRLLLLCIIICSISCEKERPVATDNAGECLGTPRNLILAGTCTDLFTNSPVTWCDIIDGGSFELLESSKEYAIQFCMAPDESIPYVNSENDTIHLKLEFKNYISSKSIYASNFQCEGDSTSKLAYCIESGLIMMAFTIPEWEDALNYRVFSRPDTNKPEASCIGDFLEISKQVSPGAWASEFEYLINRRSLGYAQVRAPEFFERITLNGNVFYEVISNDLQNPANPSGEYYYKYYVNRDFGIVGIEKDADLYTIRI